MIFIMASYAFTAINVSVMAVFFVPIKTWCVVDWHTPLTRQHAGQAHDRAIAFTYMQYSSRPSMEQPPLPDLWVIEGNTDVYYMIQMWQGLILHNLRQPLPLHHLIAPRGTILRILAHFESTLYHLADMVLGYRGRAQWMETQQINELA